MTMPEKPGIDRLRDWVDGRPYLLPYTALVSTLALIAEIV